MKTPADIEKITLAELEKMADDTSVAVPESLERKVTDAVLAAEVIGETAQRNPEEGGRRSGDVDSRTSVRNSERTSVKKVLMLVPAAAAAIVAAVAIGFNVYNSYRTPADTFSTPEEALACLEQTFGLIRVKTDKSLEVAERVRPRLEKTYGLRGE